MSSKDTNNIKIENRKSKPKALEFWESMAGGVVDGPAATNGGEDVDNNENEFKYNTIHRMSMGRRMLPKPPPGQRSQSLDRSGEIAMVQDKVDPDVASSALNNSFSGPSSLPNDPPEEEDRKSPKTQRKSSGDSGSSSSPHPDDESSLSASIGQPSPPSSETRGEVEGSSDTNNSPPTSVIQGNVANPTFDWLRGTFEQQQKQAEGAAGVKKEGSGDVVTKRWSMSKEFLSHHEELNSDKFSPKYASATQTHQNGYHSLEDEVNLLRSLRVGGDGMNSGGASSKQTSDGSSTMSDENNSNGSKTNGKVPYEVLIQDLTQAKRQLLELHNLVSASMLLEEKTLLLLTTR